MNKRVGLISQNLNLYRLFSFVSCMFTSLEPDLYAANKKK